MPGDGGHWKHLKASMSHLRPRVTDKIKIQSNLQSGVQSLRSRALLRLTVAKRWTGYNKRPLRQPPLIWLAELTDTFQPLWMCSLMPELSAYRSHLPVEGFPLANPEHSHLIHWSGIPSTSQFSLSLFLDYSGCYNKISQTGWLINNEFFLTFIEIGKSSVNEPEQSHSIEGPFLGCRLLASHCFLTWSKGWVSSLELLVSESHSVMSNSLRLPHGLYSPWNSLGQNTGLGAPCLTALISFKTVPTSWHSHLLISSP